DALHLTILRREQRAFCARFFERFARRGHLHLLESVSHDDGNAFSFEIVHRDTSLSREKSANRGHSAIFARSLTGLMSPDAEASVLSESDRRLSRRCAPSRC